MLSQTEGGIIALALSVLLSSTAICFIFVCMIYIFVTRFSKRSHVAGKIKIDFFVSFCSTYFEESFDILALG